MDTGFKLNSETLYKVGFTAALAFLPWSLKLATYALPIMIIGGLLTNATKEKINQLKQHPQAYPFLILFFLYTIGLWYSSDLYEGIKSIEQKLSLLVVPLVTATSLAFSKEDKERCLWAFVVSLSLLTVSCFAYNAYLVLRGFPYMQLNFDPYTLAHFNQFHEGASTWLRFSYIAFSNSIIEPMYLSVYLTMAALFLLHYEATSKRIVVLKNSLIIVFSLSVLLLASRMGIFVFILFFGLNLIYYLRKKNVSMVRTGGVLSGFVILMISLVITFPVTRFRLIEEPLSTPLQIPTEASDWNSINLRFLEWSSGIQGIKESGLIGTGTGSALSTLNEQYNQVELGDFKKSYDSHNQYIETYLEIGIPGLLTLLLCIGTTIVFAWKQKDKLLLSLVVMMSFTFVSASMLERGRGIVFYMLLISLFMLSNHSLKTQNERNS